ncbi:hypothetical protein DNK56_09235 [Streptomyces sp. AC1-42W]|nr:hypothetical protein DNK55_22210 [Streptomyces sp. AC1-42T]PZT82236.1 hypothetical protein DNK56_09235 [Streptomyces sp. AC1-42W]
MLARSPGGNRQRAFVATRIGAHDSAGGRSRFDRRLHRGGVGIGAPVMRPFAEGELPPRAAVGALYGHPPAHP